MDPALKELMEGIGGDEIELIVRLDPEGELPPYVRVVSRFGDIATVRLPREKIAAAWADESVLSLKAPRPFGLDPDPLPPESESDSEALDDEADDTRRPEDLDVTGRGVIVAVIDWGFDFAHPNFRNRDGSTRALALWDQSAAGPSPEPYGYGRVYTREEIDRALRHDEPYRALGYHPASGDPSSRGAHGTHVLDIAAGNGRAEGAPEGIAPEADLLFVHLATRGTEGRASLGDSVTLLEALDWVAHQAGGRPWVVNMSVGRHGGPHNGLTLVEQGIDALLAAAPGRAIVQSTGNYYAAHVHASGYLRPGQERTLRWCTDQADLTPNELEVWYPGPDVFSLEIRSPGGEVEVRVPLGGQASIEIGGREVGRAYHRVKEPNSGDNHIDVFLYTQAPPGCWQVVLTGEDVLDGRFHAWVERDAGCPSCQSRLDPEDADSSTTTGTIANGFRSITVGAYDAHSSDRPLGPFSSCGPTRDGRLKPDLLAPGVRVLAARSASLELGSDTPLLTRNSGTSMAAPHVTGTVALMFEAAARPLTIQETRKLLLSTAQEARVEGEPVLRLGSGYLDTERAVEAARSFAAPPHRENVEEERAAADSFDEIMERAAREPEPMTIGPEEESEEESEDGFGATHPEDVMYEHEERGGCACGCKGRRTTSEPVEERERHGGCACRYRHVEPEEEAWEALPWSEPPAPEWWEDEEEDRDSDETAVEEEPAEAFTESWDPAAELLELADEAAAAGPRASLLDQVLSRAESAGSWDSFGESAGTWWGTSLSPATLFDSMLAGGPLRQHFEASFEILALPGETPWEPAREGDLLVRRALGEGGLGHVAMVASGETWAAGDLSVAGLAGEAPRAGSFVHVVEGGFQPHGRDHGFARLALDETGRLPSDQLLLRPRVARPAFREAEWEETAACSGTATKLDRFETDKSDLTADHHNALDALAKTIADSQATTAPVETVCLRGHADITGGSGHNRTLGSQRATAVEAELRAKVDKLSPGLPGKLTFKPSSAGASEPVASNATPDGRARNRRVEVRLGRGVKRICLNPQVSKDDPAALGAFPVTEIDFGPTTISVPGMGSVEVKGNVVFPADGAGSKTFSKKIPGAVPIVFMAHGNHRAFLDPKDPDTDHCTDSGKLTPVRNHRGFIYLQELLASLGIIAVSVDCNSTCAFDMLVSNIVDRAALLLGSVLHFQSLHTGGDPVFGGRIDFSRLGLLGHSRGGEAVLAAAEEIAKGGSFASVTVGGVLSLAPTAVGATSGRPRGFAFMTILPAGDGDVIDNDGATFYDQATPDPFKCQLYIHDTNHNFFNREWTNDDAAGQPGILLRADHERFLSVYGGAFFREVLLSQGTLKFLKGDELPPATKTDEAHISFEQPGATTVDDHEDKNVKVNALKQKTSQTSGMKAKEFDFEQGGAATFNGTFFGKTGGMVAQTTSKSGRFRSPFVKATDLTGKEVWIRSAEIYDAVSVPAGATGFKLGLEDARGNVSFADSNDAGSLPRPYDRQAFDLANSGSDRTKTMLKTLRFPAGCFAKQGFDVRRVKAVVIQLDRGDKRAVAFDQLQIV